MSTQDAKQKLYQKLFNVMEAIDNIEKDGTNTFHGYNYTTEGAVKRTVRKELLANKLLYRYEVQSISHQELSSTNAKGTSVMNALTTVQGWAVFSDIETGEDLRIPFGGVGTDNGDKGVYKAITGAVKYSLLNALLVPTGDDAEGDSQTDHRTNIGHPAPVFRAKEVTPPIQSDPGLAYVAETIKRLDTMEPSPDELAAIFDNAVVPHEEPASKPTEICPKCQNPMYYQEWVAKSGKNEGKLMKAWKCQDQQHCKNTRWIN